MNVRCPDCLTMYRIDPAKVARRVRARCAHCAGILTIDAIDPGTVTKAVRPSESFSLTESRLTSEPAHVVEPARSRESPPAEEPAPIVVQVPRPFAQPRSGAGAGSESEPRPVAPVFHPTPGMPVKSVRVPPPARPTESPAGTAKPATLHSSSEAAAPHIASSVAQTSNPFLTRDPEERARRLARALVSDIIVYQPEKRRRALRDGTLQESFQEEIGKSWKEYRQQMGDAFANSTPYFTEALNEILAEGRQIF